MGLLGKACVCASEARDVQAANSEMLRAAWILGNTGEVRKPVGMVRRRRNVGISVLHHASMKSICD